MSGYFSILNLKAEVKRSRSIDNRSLIKYGYSNFSLEILEYCEPSIVVLREQHFFRSIKTSRVLRSPKKLQPPVSHRNCVQNMGAYNILKIAGSSLGFKHSLETKAKISRILTGRAFTTEHIAKI